MGKGKATLSATLTGLVGRYHRVFTGRLSREDLAQEAALAVAESKRRYKKDGPASFASYCYKAANCELFRAVARSGAPVYASNHEVRRLLTMVAVDLDGLVDSESNLLADGTFDALGGIEAVLDRARAYCRLRQVIEEHGGREIVDVLLGKSTLRNTAANLQVSLDTVRRRKVAAIEAIKNDAALRAYARGK